MNQNNLFQDIQEIEQKHHKNPNDIFELAKKYDELYYLEEKNAEYQNKAFLYYQDAERYGIIKAKILLAHYYALGEIVEKNEEKAFELYRDAYYAGDVDAGYHYFMCLWFGNGVVENREEARRLYGEIKEKDDFVVRMIDMRVDVEN